MTSVTSHTIHNILTSSSHSRELKCLRHKIHLGLFISFALSAFNWIVINILLGKNGKSKILELSSNGSLLVRGDPIVLMGDGGIDKKFQNVLRYAQNNHF